MQLRVGGPGLKASQSYPVAFGLQLARLAADAQTVLVEVPTALAEADKMED